MKAIVSVFVVALPCVTDRQTIVGYNFFNAFPRTTPRKAVITIDHLSVETAEIAYTCICQLRYFLRNLRCCIFERAVVTIGNITYIETIADDFEIYLYHAIKVLKV